MLLRYRMACLVGVAFLYFASRFAICVKGFALDLSRLAPRAAGSREGRGLDVRSFTGHVSAPALNMVQARIESLPSAASPLLVMF